jgi:hypothetical protein
MTAKGTTLHIAAEVVQLTFHHTAVTAGCASHLSRFHLSLPFTLTPSR